jgi:hypothetical protein
MTDSQFIADAKKSRMDVSPKTGDEALAIVKAIYDRPADITGAARKVMEE